MQQAETNRVLLVDDDAVLLRAYKRVLTQEGWAVETALDGLEASQRLQEGAFEVIVSDINMPGYGGLGFLRGVRERDLDVPVILMTGKPTVDTSVRAIEYGVFRYLLKPLNQDTLVETVGRAARLHKLARLKRRALEIAGTEGRWLGDREALEARYKRANELLWMAFQPIVAWRERRVFGYEALLRSDEPTLTAPGDILEAATRLGRLRELGRIIRAKSAELARHMPSDARLFINLHASELADDALLDAATPLARIASRVVLEVTERESLEGVSDASARVQALRKLGFQIAIDDLGAGYAGLTSFAQLEPDVVKLDNTLVRGIDALPKKQSIVQSMKKLCDELGMLVIAEGVETPAERDALAAAGCNLFQGYLFARPERGFTAPAF